MKLELTILGCNAATPTPSSHPTAQVLEISGRLFLIDCGEGTQVQLRKYSIRFSKINQIFISHLHGDHVFGLIGLISSFQLLGRTQQLTIFGPKGIKQLIEIQLQITEAYHTFELIFIELESTESVLIFEDEKVEVYTIPLKHRVYCNGYLFKEKEKNRRINAQAIKKYPEIDICDYQNIKMGKDFLLSNQTIIPNKELTIDPLPSYSYAFCSDTQYSERIIPIIQHVDLLYHEATFLNKHEDLAKKTGHSTAAQAAKIAQLAEAKQLVLGHYSNRYKELKPFINEANNHFSEVYLAEAGRKFTVK